MILSKIIIQFLLYVQHVNLETTNGILMICLNDYFALILTVNDENAHLPPLTKLTDNSLSQIICTEQEIEKQFKFSTLTKQVVMMV